jgi:tetratricopeptide (TPR) repeat protein
MGDRPAARLISRALVAVLLSAQPGGQAFARETQASAPAAARPATSPQPAAGFDALVKQATAAREAGRLEEAAASYRKALRLRPKWAEGQWYLATSLYELGHYDQALRAFDAVTAEQPLNGPAWGFKGLCKYQLKAYDAAILDLLKAREIGLGPNKDLVPVVRYHTGIILTRYEQFEYALQILSEFAVDGNDNPKVIEAMGIAALRIPVLPEGLPEARREQVLLAGRAAYFTAAQQLEPARGSLQELVTRYPDTPNVHYAFGVYLLREEPDRAIEEFKKELALSPGHVAATLQIAFEYIKRSDWEAAKPWARQAVTLSPTGFAERQAYGQVLLELGEVPAAIEQLEAGVKLAPDAPTLRFTLARAYQRAGRSEDAERERAEFLTLQRKSRTFQHGSQSVGGDLGSTAPEPTPAPPPR